MKTPREILLETHRHAEPKLDEIRTDVLRTTVAPVPSASNFPSWLLTLWEQLVLPCRRPLIGFGVAWAAILLLHATAQSHQAVSPARPTRPTADVLAQLKEQWFLREELLGQPVSRQAKAPAQPGPQSDALPRRGSASLVTEIQIV